MPTPDQILSILKQTANDFLPLAFIWHAYFLIVISAALFKRISIKVMGFALSLPVLSVSILSILSKNAFNGLLFGILAIGLVIIASRLSPELVQAGPIWEFIAGLFLFLFGSVYPHFLGVGFLPIYLIGAPMGLIPCPTLSVVIGVTLMANGFQSRSWSLTLTAFGLFYGIFGALKLGVMIDWFLFGGSLILLVGTIYSVVKVQPRSS